MNYNKNMGKLEIIMGTMFSGKTSYLLNKIALFVELNIKVLYINIDFDNRSNLEFSTHNPIFNNIDFKNKNKMNENLTMIKVRDLSNITFEKVPSAEPISNTCPLTFSITLEILINLVLCQIR